VRPIRSALQSLAQRAFHGSVAHPRSHVVTACLAFGTIASTTTISLADENGVSFWVPGFFGSLAATPQQPGWSLASIYYHTDVSGGGNIAVSREITIGQFNPTLNVNINANVRAIADIGFVIPSYVFATSLFGGQASASLLMAYGNNDTTLNATTTVALGPISLTKSIALQQDTMGLGDLIPQFAERWNAGVNNYMLYLTGDIPVGRYSSNNLANIGIGHGALDGGVGYTYFDPKAGHELSAVLGLTGNFENPSTNYTNGIDFHLDWGASQFLTKHASGRRRIRLRSAHPRQGLCPFESRVIGIGPQIGFIFPVAGMQGYLNLKAYKEFDNANRPDGWNAWVTLVLSPAPSAAESSPPPILTKAPPRS